MLEDIDLTPTETVRLVRFERVAESDAEAKRVAESDAEAKRVAESDTEAKRVAESDTEAKRVAESDTEVPAEKNFDNPVVNKMLPLSTIRDKKTTVKKPGKAAPALRLSPSQIAEANKLHIQCKRLCVSVFLDERATVRSLGFTSSIDGEGKSFLARLAAVVMATDLNIPVTLLECNWENPCFSDIFNLEQGPGLAEWLRGECELEAIRQPVSGNLTVIRAGDDKHDTIKLLQKLRQRGILDVLYRPNEVLIADLPSIVTTAYGPLAARIVESLVVVVRMGVTLDSYVAEASTHLKDLHVHGVVLNQIKSRVPQWLQQIF